MIASSAPQLGWLAPQTATPPDMIGTGGACEGGVSKPSEG
jgi:hypothetical protein